VNRKVIRWYYKFPGNFHAFGPVVATTERAARGAVRCVWCLSRLPKGTEFWKVK
jgi:hypothetical protein